MTNTFEVQEVTIEPCQKRLAPDKRAPRLRDPQILSPSKSHPSFNYHHSLSSPYRTSAVQVLIGNYIFSYRPLEGAVAMSYQKPEKDYGEGPVRIPAAYFPLDIRLAAD